MAIVGGVDRDDPRRRVPAMQQLIAMRAHTRYNVSDVP
jgi:hypothetical protein